MKVVVNLGGGGGGGASRFYYHLQLDDTSPILVADGEKRVKQ